MDKRLIEKTDIFFSINSQIQIIFYILLPQISAVDSESCFIIKSHCKLSITKTNNNSHDFLSELSGNRAATDPWQMHAKTHNTMNNKNL